MSEIEVQYADEMAASQQEIVDAWSAAVRADPLVRSDDSLSYADFLDYIPKILYEICGHLRSSVIEPAADVQESGTLHGALRWREGYDLAEVMREIAHLRQVLLDFAARRSERSGLSHAEYRNVQRRILQMLDEIQLSGARAYIDQRDRELVERIEKLRREIEP